MNQRRNIHRKIYFALSMILFFVLPLYKKAAPIIVFLMIINWLAEGHFRTKFSALFNDHWTFPTLFILAISFYLLHLISLLYTENMNEGYFELEKKLSFIVFPLIIFPIYSYRFVLGKGKYFLGAYISGALISSIYCFIQALIKYIESSDIAMMYYLNFSVFEHPTYYAMYMITALLILFNYLFKEWKNIKTKFRFAIFILLSWFTLMVLLSNSRAAILALAIVFIFSIIFVILKTKKYWIGIAVVVLLSITAISTKTLMPHVFDRFNIGIEEVLHAKKIDDIKHWNGTTIRVQIYFSSIELIKENFLFGVGSGDVTDALMEKYKKHAFLDAAIRKYNAHNQFLQSFIGLGIIGFIFLLSIILIPFIYAIRQGEFIQIAFILMIIVLFLFESMLQQQAGIMFIVFFLFFFHSKERLLSANQ